MHRSLSIAALVGTWIVGSSTALAAISQATVVPPGGFVQTGVFSANGGMGSAGEDMSLFASLQDFEEHAFAGNASASANSSYSVSPTTGSVSATCGFGFFRALADNSTVSTAFFPAAQANGGWKETFTVNNAALTGQQGFLTFQVRAQGQEQATGVSGSAYLFLVAYKNNIVLSTNPFFSAGNSDLISTSNQYGRWGIATFGNPNTDSRTVDGVVTFSVPITFGQSFTLGVYALAGAGLRSSGGFGTPCTGRADFSGSGVTWNGITGILTAGGVPVSGSTIVTGSGIDWTNPVTPCAADLSGGANVPDGGVDISDLLYFLVQFEAGSTAADLADGTGVGFPDGGVDINDLLYFLIHFEAGC